MNRVRAFGRGLSRGLDVLEACFRHPRVEVVQLADLVNKAVTAAGTAGRVLILLQEGDSK